MYLGSAWKFDAQGHEPKKQAVSTGKRYTPFSLTVCTHTHTHMPTCNLIQAFTGSAVLLINRFNGPFQLFHNFANRKKKLGSVLKKKKTTDFL